MIKTIPLTLLKLSTAALLLHTGTRVSTLEGADYWLAVFSIVALLVAVYLEGLAAALNLVNSQLKKALEETEES